MIDIHSHILWGIDDGAQGMAEAMEMARVAAADGIKTIVATPHGADWEAGHCPEIGPLVAMLQGEVRRAGFDLEILPGMENYLVPELIDQLDQKRDYALNHSSYLLIELPLQEYPPYSEEVIFQLQAKGVRPILAHPERNAIIRERHDLLERLVERGVIAQITVASLLGAFGRRTREAAEDFLEHGLAHVIASDAHSPTGHRSPVLSKGWAAAARIVGEERAYEMVTGAPACILADKEIEVQRLVPRRAKRRWALWR